MKMVFRNARGDSINLTNNEYAYLINFDGQTMIETSVSSIVTPGIDGDTINNIQAQPREVTLDLHLKDDVETAKQAILSVIKIKQACSLYWTQNNRTIKLNGVVTGVDMPRWENGVVMQITIYCEMPFWEDLQETEQQINEYESTHYFTDIENDMLFFEEDGLSFGTLNGDRSESFGNAGDVDTGLKITITARGTVTNPLITNSEGEYFGIGTTSNPYVLSAGENIEINTARGKKSVKKGNTSLYDRIKTGSTWLQFKAGENQYTISSDDSAIDNMTVTFAYKQRYI